MVSRVDSEGRIFGGNPTALLKEKSGYNRLILEIDLVSDIKGSWVTWRQYGPIVKHSYARGCLAARISSNFRTAIAYYEFTSIDKATKFIKTRVSCRLATGYRKTLYQHYGKMGKPTVEEEEEAIAAVNDCVETLTGEQKMAIRGTVEQNRVKLLQKLKTRLDRHKAKIEEVKQFNTKALISRTKAFIHYWMNDGAKEPVVAFKWLKRKTNELESAIRLLEDAESSTVEVDSYTMDSWFKADRAKLGNYLWSNRSTVAGVSPSDDEWTEEDHGEIEDDDDDDDDDDEEEEEE